MESQVAEPTADAAPMDPPARALHYLKRWVAWSADGIVIAAVVLALGFLVWAATLAIAGSAFGLVGGGVSGLFAGTLAGAGATLIAFGLTLVVAVAVPLTYLRWCVHRSGPNAGRTLGQQLVDVRIVRARGDARPIRTRTLLLREVLLQLELMALMAGASFVALAIGAPVLFAALVMVAIGFACWRAADGCLPHDWITNTRVVDWRAPASARPAPTFTTG